MHRNHWYTVTRSVPRDTPGDLASSHSLRPRISTTFGLHSKTHGSRVVSDSVTLDSVFPETNDHHTNHGGRSEPVRSCSQFQSIRTYYHGCGRPSSLDCVEVSTFTSRSLPRCLVSPDTALVTQTVRITGSCYCTHKWCTVRVDSLSRPKDSFPPPVSTFRAPWGGGGRPSALHRRPLTVPSAGGTATQESWSRDHPCNSGVECRLPQLRSLTPNRYQMVLMSVSSDLNLRTDRPTFREP